MILLIQQYGKPTYILVAGYVNRGEAEEERFQVVNSRLAVAREEIAAANAYDYVVINDSLEQCVEEIGRIIDSEKFRSFRMKTKIEEVLVND